MVQIPVTPPVYLCMVQSQQVYVVPSWDYLHCHVMAHHIHFWTHKNHHPLVHGYFWYGCLILLSFDRHNCHLLGKEKGLRDLLTRKPLSVSQSRQLLWKLSILSLEFSQPSNICHWEILQHKYLSLYECINHYPKLKIKVGKQVCYYI